ncbi:AtpZ/AtpI family protein [Stappia albiluteola]|nr:AtpZ/AtpI family protein [Stappia albiluteola]
MVSPRDPGQEEGKAGPPDAGLSKRMEQLSRSLDAKRQTDERNASSGRRRESDARGFALAMRLSTEFVAGVLVGGGIGWLFDAGLGTSPWGLIVFLLLGFVAGVLNVLRSAGKLADPLDRERGG